MGPNSKLKNCTSVAPNWPQNGPKIGGCKLHPLFLKFWARGNCPLTGYKEAMQEVYYVFSARNMYLRRLGTASSTLRVFTSNSSGNTTFSGNTVSQCSGQKMRAVGFFVTLVPIYQMIQSHSGRSSYLSWIVLMYTRVSKQRDTYTYRMQIHKWRCLYLKERSANVRFIFLAIAINFKSKYSTNHVCPVWGVSNASRKMETRVRFPMEVSI
jgi:hypothetical protein